jgi:colanic acid/amylovoran biosynthesis protein
MILDELKRFVVLVPHVQNWRTGDNDLRTATNVHRLMHFDKRIRLAGGDLTAAEMKAIFAGAELVVAQRMHAAIGGMSAAVPTVTAVYTRKGYDLPARMYGTDLAALSQVSWPPETFLQREKMAKSLHSVWEAREVLAQALRNRLPMLRSAAERNLDLLEEFVRGRTAAAS